MKNKYFYNENGYLLKNDFIDKSTIASIMDNSLHLIKRETVQVKKMKYDILTEDNHTSLRRTRNPHLSCPLFLALANNEKIVSLAKNILKEDIYIHHTKLNYKEAFSGGHYDWHQDSIYWKDTLPYSDTITVIVLLDSFFIHNGPLMVIPKSHKQGMIDVLHRDEIGIANQSYPENRLKNLPLSLPNEIIKQEAKCNGIKTILGGSGSVLFMHGCTFHASNLNLSPYERRAFLIRYNKISNK